MATDLTSEAKGHAVGVTRQHARETRVLAVVAAALSLLVAVGTALNLHYPGRSLATVAFVVVASGWPIVSYVGFTERLVEFIAAVCVSVSCGILLAMAQVLLHAWHPEAVVAIWAAVIALIGLPQAARRTPITMRTAERPG